MLLSNPMVSSFMGIVCVGIASLATPAPLHAQSPADSASAFAALESELAQMDSLLFDALFVRCDAGRANSVLDSDVEFYDDRSGLSRGDAVRDNSRRLAENCPADHGVRRILLPSTVEVHRIGSFGAVQTGVHHFVERGATTSTIGRFTHIWRRTGGQWKLARVISLHEIVDATEAAKLRR